MIFVGKMLGKTKCIPSICKLGGPNVGASATVSVLAAAFDQHLAPAAKQVFRQQSTKADYERAWRLVVTWAVARKAVLDILPISLEMLKALTWDLVCFAVLPSRIELVWKSMQAQHRH